MIQIPSNMGLFLIENEKIPRLSSHIYCFYYLSIFLILTVFCCGKISFILNGFIPLQRRSTAGNLLTVLLVLEGSFYSNFKYSFNFFSSIYIFVS